MNGVSAYPWPDGLWANADATVLLFRWSPNRSVYLEIPSISNNRVSCPSATKLPKGIGFLSMLAGLSQKSPSSEELFVFLFFLHIKDSLKMTINGVIDKRLDVRNDSFYRYDNRANVSPLPYGLWVWSWCIKRFSRFAGPQIVLCIWRFLLFAYGCFRSWPLCCWEHMVFSSAWQNCSQQKLFLFGGAFLLLFCKKKRRGFRLLFSFFQAAFPA